MKIKIINGVNLNMLGIRDVDIYGKRTYKDLAKMIFDFSLENQLECDCFVSNFEGEIVEAIHDTYLNKYDALIINPGAFTHYSYAIRDALQILTCLKIEVHISDINHREAFRKNNVIKDVCDSSIIGKGLDGYIEAIKYILKNR
ncbi:3-dehydroquinate dehydratase [Mycoplasmatota bacterium]|nr:3-dehydroquinate dehydratase [Mycoplasmatota bacterium]